MTQRLHLVFGGELIDPSKNAFKDVEAIDIVGMFPDYETAYNRGKPPLSGPSTTRICAITSRISIACVTKKPQHLRPKNWAIKPDRIA